MSFFLSFSFFLSLFFFQDDSLGAQGLSDFTFLPGLLRPDWEGALHLHRGGGVLRPHPTERAPVASVNRASSVSGALLAFCVNQRRSSLFLSPFTFLIADAVILKDSLDPAGAGPRYGTFCVLLLSLHLMFSSFIHVVVSISTSFFLLWNNIPWCRYTTFYLSV